MTVMNTKREINDLYDYGYYIYQNPDYFKFSIDSVLLAEFVCVHKNKNKVLDLCSGNAPVPMILSIKYGDRVDITGVELQDEIFELGKDSIEYAFEYGKQFWTKYKDNRKFSAMVTNDGHESSLEALKYSDDMIYNYFDEDYNE